MIIFIYYLHFEDILFMKRDTLTFGQSHECVTISRSAEPFTYEEGGSLSVHFGATGTVQSQMLVDAPDLLVLDYTRTIMGFLLFLAQPEHIGMIGLGGGSIQKYCYRYLPQT